MQLIWSLLVKGLQSWGPSNFENNLTPDELDSGPNALAHTSTVKADFFLGPQTGNLQPWQQHCKDRFGSLKVTSLTEGL